MKVFLIILVFVTLQNAVKASTTLNTSSAITIAENFDNSLADTIGEGDIELGNMIGFSVNSTEVTIMVEYKDADGKDQIMKCVRNHKTSDETFTNIKSGETF
jgi:hypothetical protein